MRLLRKEREDSVYIATFDRQWSVVGGVNADSRDRWRKSVKDGFGFLDMCQVIHGWDGPCSDIRGV
jgi:hypothetical protein